MPSTPHAHRIIRSSIVAVIMILIGTAMGFCQEATTTEKKPKIVDDQSSVIEAQPHVVQNPHFNKDAQTVESDQISKSNTIEGTVIEAAKIQPTRSAGVESASQPMVETHTVLKPAYQPIKGFTEDLRAAVKDSKKTDRPIMLVFTGADWCVWCKRLEEEVFNTPEFNEWDDVVKVNVNFPKAYQLPANVTKQNELLKKKFKSLITSYPTVLIVDHKGSVIAKTGYHKGGAKNWMLSTCKLLPETEVRLARKKAWGTELSKANDKK